MKSKVWRSIFFYIWNASIKTFFSLSLIKKSHFTLKGKQKKYNQIKGRFLKKLELKLKVNLFYRNICKNAFFFFFLEHHKKVHCPRRLPIPKFYFQLLLAMQESLYMREELAIATFRRVQLNLKFLWIESFDSFYLFWDQVFLLPM